jgi:hypothetical protein
MLDPTSISALSVLGGSLVGGLTSLASTWMTQQHLARRELLSRQLAERETLYSDFISEASRTAADSMTHSLDRVEALVPLYALLGRIRLSASGTVLAAAEKVVAEILLGYSRPNLTALEFQELTLSQPERLRVSALAQFSHICREELAALREGKNQARPRT